MSEDSMYFDPRVKQEATSRNRKVFKFNEPGGLYLDSTVIYMYMYIVYMGKMCIAH